ncbi:MAG: 50S ribosomal protein L30e [Candidatus Bathyarchaeia archaeon]
MISLDEELKRAISTGKVLLGTRSLLREVRTGRAKLVVISSNCPQYLKEKILRFADLSKIPMIQHNKTGVDLGTLCGKPFIVSGMVIKDAGDSRIMSLVTSGDA